MEKILDSAEPDFPNPKVEEPDSAGIYSYADYLRWTISERVELIAGHIFRMGAAPNRLHQDLSLALLMPLHGFLKNGICKVYPAPFDVRLPVKSLRDEDVFTVVQPDLCVICDPEKLDDKGCIGAPDIVVEILSPSNNKKELRIKHEVYEHAGVKEYWIVFPYDRTIQKFMLAPEGKFGSIEVLSEGDVLRSSILPGFSLSMDELFASN